MDGDTGVPADPSSGQVLSLGGSWVVPEHQNHFSSIRGGQISLLQSIRTTQTHQNHSVTDSGPCLDIGSEKSYNKLRLVGFSGLLEAERF